MLDRTLTARLNQPSAVVVRPSAVVVRPLTIRDLTLRFLTPTRLPVGWRDGFKRRIAVR